MNAGQEKDLMKRHVSPVNTHYEVRDLHKSESYEFWVTAFTRVGEGQSTPVVFATINNQGIFQIIENTSSMFSMCHGILFNRKEHH